MASPMTRATASLARDMISHRLLRERKMIARRLQTFGFGENRTISISIVFCRYSKSITPASLNWTGSENNYTVKLNAALGYEIDLGNNTQFIPYVSANQSLTDAAKKPRTIDPNNNVAVGFLATNFSANPYNNTSKTFLQRNRSTCSIPRIAAK